jgi:hypothetical protein
MILSDNNYIVLISQELDQPQLDKSGAPEPWTCHMLTDMALQSKIHVWTSSVRWNWFHRFNVTSSLLYYPKSRLNTLVPITRITELFPTPCSTCGVVRRLPLAANRWPEISATTASKWDPMCLRPVMNGLIARVDVTARNGRLTMENL